MKPESKRTAPGPVVPLLLSLCFLAALLAGCALPSSDFFSDGGFKTGGTNGKTNGYQKLVTDDPEITLQWDPPSSEVTSYKIFYRVHGNPDWTLLDEIPAEPEPRYTVTYMDLGKGSYDFAVVAVDPGDAESAMHTSLDHTASPTTGWYLVWD